MAARYNKLHLDICREKIKVSQLLNLLQNNAFGKIALDPVRQRSAEICLKKALPDLSATEITGSIASYVARLPEPAANVQDWIASTEKPLLVTSPLPTEPQPVDIASVACDSLTQHTTTDTHKPTHGRKGKASTE